MLCEMTMRAGKMRLLLLTGTMLLCACGVASAQQAKDDPGLDGQRRSFDFPAPDPSAILTNPASADTPRRPLRDFGPEAKSVKPVSPETPSSKPKSDIADEFKQP